MNILLIVATLLFLPVATGITAKQFGRSFLFWFALTAVFQIFGLVLLLCLRIKDGKLQRRLKPVVEKKRHKTEELLEVWW